MKKIFVLAIISVFFLCSCDLLTHEFMGRYGLKDCSFELTSVSTDIYPDYSNLYNSYAMLNLHIRVDNPNKYAVILDRMSFDLLINDKTVLSDIENSERRDVDAGSSLKFSIPVKVTYKELNNASDGLFDVVRSGEARYKLDSTVFFDSEFGSYSYKTTISESKI